MAGTFQPGIASSAKVPEMLTVTQRIAGEILTLPMFATISEASLIVWSMPYGSSPGK